MASTCRVTAAFVYGSLLAEEVLQKLLGRVPASASALVTDYHRYSLRNEIYPAVAPKPGDVVKGKVLFGLSEREMAIFDDFEDVQYVRTLVQPTLMVPPPLDGVVAKDEGEPQEVLAYMYVWAKQNDPDLVGDWDYERWREAYLEEYVEMCGQYMEELSQSGRLQW